MKYIIMADGSGTRWNNYGNIPKHLLKIDGETLLERTVRLLHEADPQGEIIITSHDPRYEVKHARRYEPKNNVLEIDRFTAELIEDDIFFLYGDTYYTESSVKTILEAPAEELLFFGNTKSIVAIKIRSSACFKKHMENVRKLFLEGAIKGCKGWQVYQSYAGLEFDKKQIGPHFITIADDTQDYNTPQEFLASKKS
ncbi:MAG: NTP transferase domain-containing protein [Christensenellaceae bacterium]|nr:NTP transferase domain-containing protein [Christensenellaceae bacterium]